jgi:hypothetical protein
VIIARTATYNVSGALQRFFGYVLLVPQDLFPTTKAYTCMDISFDRIEKLSNGLFSQSKKLGT